MTDPEDRRRTHQKRISSLRPPETLAYADGIGSAEPAEDSNDGETMANFLCVALNKGLFGRICVSS